MGTDVIHPDIALVPSLEALWSLAFGDEPEFIQAFFSAGFAPRHCRVVRSGEAAAAALYWFDVSLGGQRLAYLYGVATHPAHRGKGLCRRLMADTQALLTRAGYAGILLLPGSSGLREMYRKMGYADCCTYSRISAAAGTAVPLRTLRRAEYASLRRQYLPRGGVLQEGENLSFLCQFAKLYAGEDFLLAASLEGGTLQGLELLGNPQAAPGILAALGCKTGTFRLPGGDTQGAMLRPLSPSLQKPTYFGLPFD